MLDTMAALAGPWADFFGGSAFVQGLVTFLHIGGIVAAGGLALAADRNTFRVTGRPPEFRREHLRELAVLHRPVVWGLGVVVLSGFALALADVETFIPSWLFWTKMAVFGILLANGMTIQKAEAGLATDLEDDRGWKRLRYAAARSVGLWGILILLGVLLPLEA